MLSTGEDCWKIRAIGLLLNRLLTQSSASLRDWLFGIRTFEIHDVMYLQRIHKVMQECNVTQDTASYCDRLTEWCWSQVQSTVVALLHSFGHIKGNTTSYSSYSSGQTYHQRESWPRSHDWYCSYRYMYNVCTCTCTCSTRMYEPDHCWQGCPGHWRCSVMIQQRLMCKYDVIAMAFQGIQHITNVHNIAASQPQVIGVNEYCKHPGNINTKLQMC